MPETPEKDPILSQSFTPYFLVAAFLLIVTLLWSLYDEVFGMRPWKSYQRRFVRAYTDFLKKQIPKQAAAEKEIRNSPEFQALEQKLEEMEKEVAEKSKDIDERMKRVDARLAVITREYTTRRAYVTSRVYELDHASSGRRKRSIQDDIDRYRAQTVRLTVPNPADGKLVRASFDYPQLEGEFDSLREEKARRLSEKAERLRPVSELRQKRDAYVQDRLNGLGSEQLRGLQAKMQKFTIEIKQTNNPDAGLVDRCESCHLGIREPVALTKKDMGGEVAFVNHPATELLRIHNPEKSGCSPCHNGNGMQVESAEKAHGKYEHWLWPLHPRGNFEAGCQQCHAGDMVVAHAPVLSAGKELFQWRGCMGCHRFQGYDPEPEELISVQQQIAQLEAQRSQTQRDIQRAIKAGDEAPDNETARQYYLKADVLRVSISETDARLEQLDYRSKNLLREMKKVGPDLKEVRVKLRPAWLPEWIANPHEFRPATRMPRFRLAPMEVKAIAAFIWQSGIDATLPHQPAGDPLKGKETFETRGCMGCHSVGEGADAVGGTFAANLTRVGEKVNYDYLARWIHNPRERTRPYCPYEKRDLTEEDYRKKGLPFVFDLEHSTCPNDGHELQVEQMTVMPSLRLSWQESRDIASYLMTLKTKEPSADPQAPFLNDPHLKAQGKALVQQYGCAGCHEIAGSENEGRIGTELTKEGSKPLEQIDFALFRQKARREGWFSHKGFFERKLEKPNLFDEGMAKAPNERLRMPDFNLKKEEIVALTTFLMGSVDSTLPKRYFYLPEDRRKDVQEGWWIVKKYNCMGCHQFQVGQDSALMKIPRYQTPEWKDQLPPKLMGEGARVNPEWLLKFLSNPAMRATDTDRNGVRPYLKARMPTFYFSPGEVRKLVKFFQALDSQPMPYIAPQPEPLTNQELAMARALFTSPGAPCLSCHATGDPSHDRFATAPNFLLAPERLKPGWTKRWILDPSMISPGTAMPSGLFKRQEDHWVFSGPTPPIFKGYDKDHADLLVRYMFEITPEEQRRLIGMTRASLSPPRGREKASALQAGISQTLLKAH